MHLFVYYYTLALTSLLLFLYGFFPVQQNQLTEPIRPPTFLNDIQLNVSQLYKQEIDRIILIVIDALRIDFITEKNMPFLEWTSKDNGCMLSMKVESPTVTLPRIKALTTGSIPQFVDVIRNLASTEILQDSFLHRAVEMGKKIIFYGDDTWIKLYPTLFTRYEGVSSFFVNDYTEVDNNVTRNVLNELNKEDWDIMVLHYLGLDHIGHVFGPFSHLVQPKLKEMDSIIKKIYSITKATNKNTVVLVTGDHGMKDSGGHGGSTEEETHVPFVTIGIPCKTALVAQTDLPPTLAALMGLTLPANNVGHVILNMLSIFPTDRLLYILYYNALSLNVKTKEYGSLFEKASLFYYEYLKSNNENSAAAAQELYVKYCNIISDKLVHSSVKQDINILLKTSALLVSCFCLILHDFVQNRTKQTTMKMAFLLAVLFILQYLIPMLLYLVITTVFILYYLIQIFKVISWKQHVFSIRTVVVFCTILHVLSLLSSSFIEEEHQVWYFFWGTFVIVACGLAVDKFKIVFHLLPLFLGLRLLRTLNQTGDKWAHLPDLSQWLLLEENYIYLQMLLCISLILLWLCCCSLQTLQFNTLLLNSIIIILIYIFHSFGIQNPSLGRLIWLFILIRFSISLLQCQHIEGIIITWILLCAVLMRSYNVILLPACVYTSRAAYKCISNIEILTVIHIWLGKTMFFLQGHSNSLASVDVACGYVGLQEYIPYIVITQVLCHTYAFVVLSNLLLLKHCFSKSDKIWSINIINQLLVLTPTCILVLIQRHHLFVWTVFAPKLLIEACHSVVIFIQLILFYSVVFIKSAFVYRYKQNVIQ